MKTFTFIKIDHWIDFKMMSCYFCYVYSLYYKTFCNYKPNFTIYNVRLGNKTVSWMRQDHLHLLTVGRFRIFFQESMLKTFHFRYTYTSDLRFEAKHEQHSSDWSLILNSAQSTDSGQYQCQISTTPIITHNIWLTVNGM